MKNQLKQFLIDFVKRSNLKKVITILKRFFLLTKKENTETRHGTFTKVNPNTYFKVDSDHLFSLLEVNKDSVWTSPPLSLSSIEEIIQKRYKEQPLVYFNEASRLKLVNLTTGVVKDIRMELSIYYK